jgi:creatinine amidohydrolase
MVAIHFPTIHYAVTDWAGASRGLGVDRGAHGDRRWCCRPARRRARWASIGWPSSRRTSSPGTSPACARWPRRYAEAHAGEPLLFPDTTRRALAARLTAEYQSGSCHAGQYETSLVLALRPELVRWELARALPAHPVPLARAHPRRGPATSSSAGWTGVLRQAGGGERGGGRALARSARELVVEAVVAAFSAA